MEKWRFPAIRLEKIGSATSHLVRKSPELYVKELFYLSSHTMLYSITVNSYTAFCKKRQKRVKNHDCWVYKNNTFLRIKCYVILFFIRTYIISPPKCPPLSTTVHPVHSVHRWTKWTEGFRPMQMIRADGALFQRQCRCRGR